MVTASNTATEAENRPVYHFELTCEAMGKVYNDEDSQRQERCLHFSSSDWPSFCVLSLLSGNNW
jgi:hypothetical protein